MQEPKPFPADAERPAAPPYAYLLAFARDVAACMPGEDDDPSSLDQETLSGLAAAARAMLDGGPYSGASPAGREQ